ncbi:hypothetical protein [Pseudaestuariivita rosea]|uniref:hypothetical protein n=1 Tax=Pseudaestuariivita rosea TaxID=2763263 RepID=UPI001ABAF4B0|nr:hypothetical protein [Pseudaestuariivita rosea]
MKKFAFAAVALTALSFVLFAQNQSDTDENIHPPFYSIGVAPRYEADRVIEMTLHEYDRLSGIRHKTTGHFTTFGIEMKYLGRAATIAHEEDIAFFLTITEWDENRPDQIRAGNSIDGYSASVAIDNKFVSNISVTRGFSLPFWNNRLREAKMRNQSFSGYAPGATRGDIYDLRDSYCGYEMFENTEARLWHVGEPHDLTRTAPQTVAEPFTRARIFGLPNDSGDYSVVAECEVRDLKTGRTSCLADAQFNSYIVKSIRFEGRHLCNLPAFITAHQEFLKARVVAQN